MEILNMIYIHSSSFSKLIIIKSKVALINVRKAYCVVKVLQSPTISPQKMANYNTLLSFTKSYIQFHINNHISNKLMQIIFYGLNVMKVTTII